MKTYLFKQAVHLGKKDYPRGLNSVPEEIETDSTFLKYVSLGLIHEANEAPVITSETTEARSKKLLDRLTAQAAAKTEKTAKKEPPAPIGGVASVVTEPPKTAPQEPADDADNKRGGGSSPHTGKRRG